MTEPGNLKFWVNSRTDRTYEFVTEAAFAPNSRALVGYGWERRLATIQLS